MRLREALGDSLNVPAVWTAEQVGVGAAPRAPARARLRIARREDAGYYGPALALGDGEVTLLELARAYATLARGGHRPAAARGRAASTRRGRHRDARARAGEGRRVMPSASPPCVTDILARPRRARAARSARARPLDFPFDVAAKTGTSKGYRDNWAVGFTREVTVAAWVGNFDGRR